MRPLDPETRARVIRATKCPTCEASPGNKCLNILLMMDLSRQTQRNARANQWPSRLAYNQYVHAARVRAFQRLQKPTAKGRENRA